MAREANQEIQQIDVVKTKDKENSFIAIEKHWESLNDVLKVLDERRIYLERIRSKIEKEKYDESAIARRKAKASNKRLACTTVVVALLALLSTIPGTVLDALNLRDYPTCLQGEAHACFCDDKKSGTSICNAEGKWSECLCK